MRSKPALPFAVLLIACGPEPAPAVPAAIVAPAPSTSEAPRVVAPKDAGPPAQDPGALAEAVHGEDADTARSAAVALATSTDPKAQAMLTDAIQLCDKERRQRVLEALRDNVGAPALVPLLSVKPPANTVPERAKFQTKQLMDMLASLADPRGADGLVAYIGSSPPPHWKTEAAFRLGEVGDLRAVPTLAWRMKQDPLKLYDQVNEPEWRRDDNERVKAARMLADLATMYPNARGDLRAAAEAPTMAWLSDRPQPHANGMRFLAAAESMTFLTKLRTWADPKLALPRAGQQDFPTEFATAQSALRYLGRANPPKAFEILEKQLHRKPANADVTMDALLSGGLAAQGMSLRALGVGASQGLAEMGDGRATPLLEAYIEDAKENEQARLEACFALAWVASDAALLDVAKRAGTFAKGATKQKLIAACYLETLQRRSTPEVQHALLTTFMTTSAAAELRSAAARALGFGGVADADEAALVRMLHDAALANDAALALLLGGTAVAASQVVAPHAGDPEAIKVLYNQSFGFFSDRAYADGHIARWARNADACAPSSWPVEILSRALAGIEYDNGPHSLTRPVFRHLLLVDARGATEPKRNQARRLLEMAGEKGVLLSLK